MSQVELRTAKLVGGRHFIERYETAATLTTLKLGGKSGNLLRVENFFCGKCAGLSFVVRVVNFLLLDFHFFHICF